jgi:O-glycosyl hydrolase
VNNDYPQEVSPATIHVARWLPVIAALFFCPAAYSATAKIDGSKTYQTIDGFGVNVNYRSWNGSELQPVLDAFVDQAGMTSFRVVFDLADWEAANDNSDPNVMNWSYYNSVYSDTEFTRLWDMFTYLNSRGISDGAFLNFMGWGPSWMMASDGRTLNAGKEAEWAEMIASAVIYARNTRGLRFSLIAPTNEPDIYNEGIHMDAATYTNALHQLALLLDANGLTDIGFIGPDCAAGGMGYMPEMMADPVVMAKLRKFGVHSYSAAGGGSADVYDYILNSAYPDRNFWMTEFNVWCPTCDSGTKGIYDWTYTRGTADYLLNHLLNGASAALVWEGYDSIYAHGGYAWSYWGLFAVNDINAAVKTYTPRKHFYTVAQVSKFVHPGAQRVDISGALSPFTPLLAFKHTALGEVTIVGINTSSSAATLTGTLASLPAISSFDLYYTSATVDMTHAGTVPVNNGAFTATIPADCVFTLTGLAGVSVAVTAPTGGARFNAPATVPIAATATSTVGTIEEVSFYNGSTLLNATTSAPYQFTWSSVPMGSYLISAGATDTAGNIGVSAGVNVSVIGAVAQINITPPSVTLVSGASQQFAAAGTDQMGQAVDPSTVYSWSVSGGGTIDGSGRFTAGSTAGGPFTVTAGSGGVNGTATVTVITSSPVKVGNAVEGTLTDTVWDSGAWINAARFQATTTLNATAVAAKVGAASGRYKCAIYSDSSSHPSRLLGSTSEVSGPVAGWQTFPLASSVTLTSGTYYWLAIWSNDASARVYYSGTNGTLRWGSYSYGAWPDPIATTGGSNFNYCIYALGSTAQAPTLTSIAVTPPNPTVAVGTAQQFTATGTYSDASAQDLTNQVTWTSSNMTRATISSAGLATGVSAGATTVSAAFGGSTGSTVLTVQAVPPVPLSVTTSSLAGSTVGTAYSATLTATGGVTPYTWAVVTGSLPAGLILNTGTGAVTGTPTAVGTSNFTVQVSDAENPIQTATKNLAIAVAVASATVTIWPSTAIPALVDGGADSSVELGVKFRSDVAGTITCIRFYKASSNTGTHVGNLWSSTGTLLASATFSGETSSGWQQVKFSTPIAITAQTEYLASYHCAKGHYSADVNFFASTGVDKPPLHALSNSVGGGNCVYRYGTGNQFPNQTWKSANYWVDVVFAPTGP